MDLKFNYIFIIITTFNLLIYKTYKQFVISVFIINLINIKKALIYKSNINLKVKLLN